MNKISKESCKYRAECSKSLRSRIFLSNNYPLNNSDLNRFAPNASLPDSFLQLNIFNNISNDREQDNKTTIDKEFFCNCIQDQYECTIFTGLLERNLIEDKVLKNAFLGLYLIIMLAAIFINFVLIILIIKTEQNSSCTNFFRRITQLSVNSNSTRSKTKRLNLYNLDNNILLVSLLISYLLTILYVLPKQVILFYSSVITYGLGCKFTEFTKGFTISLTIFSLVAISLQQLISLKYCALMNSSSLDKETFRGFLKKIFQRKDFITWTLVILAWLFAFAIGYFHMSQFKDEYLYLEYFDIFIETLSCKFPSYMKAKYEYCTIDPLFWLSQDTINTCLFVILLVIPNVIIFLSYGYICYHIWSSSRHVLSVYDKEKLKEAKDQIFYISIQNSSYQRINKANYTEILEVVQTYSIGILNQEQIVTLVNMIKEKDYKSPVSIDINYVPQYNGFQVETIVKAMDSVYTKKNSISKNTLSTSNIIKKRNKTVTLTICLMAICFTLCWSPFFSFALFYTKINDVSLYINLKVTIHLIGYSSSIWSPLIYVLRCEKFKSSVRPLFSSIKLRLKNFFMNFKRKQDMNKEKSSKVSPSFKKPFRLARVEPTGY